MVQEERAKHTHKNTEMIDFINDKALKAGDYFNPTINVFDPVTNLAYDLSNVSRIYMQVRRDETKRARRCSTTKSRSRKK